MKILIYESDLIWSTRLKNAVKSLGHEPVVIAKPLGTVETAGIAIINLGSSAFQLDLLVQSLHDQGIKIIAHAGHKEKQLHELGQTLGCDILATNSQMAHSLEKLISESLNLGN